MNEFIISKHRIKSYSDMNQELPDKLTPVKSQDMLYVLAYAWVNLFNEQPKKESLLILLSQISVECGVNFSGGCHNFNYGNIKYRPQFTCDYVFFKCGELVPLNVAKQMVGRSEKDGGQAIITGVRSDGNAWITLFPSNIGCKFVAFSTKEEGAIFYLSFIKNKYSKIPEVWEGVIEGNSSKFISGLKKGSYFTADEDVYKKAVMKLYNQFQKLELDYDKLPIMSEEQKQKIYNLIYITLLNK